MVKKEITIIADVEHSHPLTLAEICRLSHLSEAVLYEFMDYDIIHPIDMANMAMSDRTQFMFDVAQLVRLQRALRLQRDLEVNLAGIAFALELLDEINTLHHQLDIMERHYSQK